MFPEKHNITDDICLYTVNTNKFKTDTLSFSVTLPQTPKTRVALTLLAGLMHRGTVSYPSHRELNRALDELYGTYLEIKSRRIGNNVTFSIGCELLSDKYVPDSTDVSGGVIHIASELFLAPLAFTRGLPDGALEKERRIFSDNLDSIKDNTRTYASSKSSELLYRSCEGEVTVEELKKILADITLDDIAEVYNSLINTSPLEIFYIGSMEMNALAEKLKAAFERFSPASEAKIRPLLPHASSEYIFESEKMPVCQGKLSIAMNTGVVASMESNDYYTALVLNEILGGSPASKLFLNVREKMGLCYYCASSYSIYSGIIKISSGIDADKLETVMSAILHELDTIKNGEFTLCELEAAKRSLVNSYLQLYDSPFDLQSFYSSRAVFGIKCGIEECRDGILAVNPQDITALAKKITLDAAFFVEGTADGEDDTEDDDE